MRRKIAFILPNFNAGGAERVMITIANHIDRLRFEPLIIAFNKSGPLISLVASDIKIITLDTSKIRYGALRLIKVIHQEKPDAVLSTMAHLNFLLLMTSPFLPPIPLIVREAITPDYFSGNILKKAVLNGGYKILYPRAARIISPSERVFAQMPASLRRRKSRCVRIFNPVNTDLLKNGENPVHKEMLVPDDKKLFVAAGRLVHQKGFDRLIESLTPWKARADWKLIILGEGPEDQSLRKMIVDKGFSQIELLGFAQKPWQYYAVADAFLLPSRHEGLPNVALEALAMGTPVIAMNSAGGIAEIAQEAAEGSIKIAFSMEEFVSFMERVPLRGDGDKILLPDCFSLQAITKSYEDLLDACIEES